MYGSLMGDPEDDPFFGTHMQSMRQFSNMMNSMNSMFADPFGMMGAPPSIMGPNPNMQPGMQMMPFGFPQIPNMTQMFSSFNNMAPNPNCHSFSSSSIMTMTSTPDGRPQVYQESTSTRCAPGGIKETKKTVSDSMTGTKKMAIGHHIGDRAHILEREQNMHSGDQEERQEFVNLDEDEAESFNNEWTSKTRQTFGAIRAPHYRPHNYNYQDDEVLALPSTVPRSIENDSKESQKSSSTSTTKPNPNSKTTSLKREHTPEPETNNKKLASKISKDAVKKDDKEIEEVVIDDCVKDDKPEILEKESKNE